eukprot:55954-Eustigmatos_ZCMA.PRE.1
MAADEHRFQRATAYSACISRPRPPTQSHRRGFERSGRYRHVTTRLAHKGRIRACTCIWTLRTYIKDLILYISPPHTHTVPTMSSGMLSYRRYRTARVVYHDFNTAWMATSMCVTL